MPPPPLLVRHYEVTLSFVNSSQMFGRHESNAGPWIFQFIPARHHLGNECCCVAPVKTRSSTQSLLESMSTGIGGGVRCDKRSNGGIGRKMVVKRDEWKPNYHLQRIKYG